MYKLVVENKRGVRLTLSNNESNYQVINVDGLNPPKAAIISSKIAGMDGSRFSSAKLEERNIVLTIKINGDIESNRLNLYNIFKTKQYCKIYFTTKNRDVYAEGYVDTIENPLFTNDEQMQISVICQDPYLKAIDEIVTDISEVVPKFTFPFAFGAGGLIEDTLTDTAIEFSTIELDRIVNIVNSGETETGVIIEIQALGEVVNPSIVCMDTDEIIRVNCTLEMGDVLIINTLSGEKSIILRRDGVEYNYLKHIARGSSWLKVQYGDNQFIAAADSGSILMSVLFKFRAKYEAV